MAVVLLWALLFVLCWPLAVFALVVFPLLWLLSLPLRFVFTLLVALTGLVAGVARALTTLLALPFRAARLGRRKFSRAAA